MSDTVESVKINEFFSKNLKGLGVSTRTETVWIRKKVAVLWGREVVRKISFPQLKRSILDSFGKGALSVMRGKWPRRNGYVGVMWMNEDYSWTPTVVVSLDSDKVVVRRGELRNGSFVLNPGEKGWHNA